MKILIIIADCIQINCSANLCHLAYIRGLLDAGHEVTLVSADGRDYSLDPLMVVPEDVIQHTFYGVSLYEKLSLRKKADAPSNPVAPAADSESEHPSGGFKSKVKRFVRSLYGIHRLRATFVRKAQKFRSDILYDYLLSISDPPASHLLAHNLLKAGHVQCKHWIQIWEDPWHNDVYGFCGSEDIKDEERRLLSFAQKVCYVSPLTLKNQQEKYSESAHKMYWQPLPFYYKADEVAVTDFKANSYGYFGDYAPAARNLEPFYLAAKETGVEVNICGNPSSLFASTEKIHIYPRLSLDQLKPIEDKTNVLVFLCNRIGGQIPGKIYQYSATNKMILFILDGTEEEKEVLQAYFEKYNRFIFCQNTVEDISRAIRLVESNQLGNIKNVPLDDFSPAKTVQSILKEAE